MRHLLRLLREWWDGIREQIALIAFTKAVLTLSKLAKPKVEAWAKRVNEATDKKFGEKANVIQREIADVLDSVAKELRA